MDSIFRRTTSIFNVVKIARETPRRYGKNGELLVAYDETDEHRERVGAVTQDEKATAFPDKSNVNPYNDAENGHSDSTR